MKKIEAKEYECDMANGIQITVDGEIVAIVDILKENEEIRIFSYQDGLDEPVTAVSYNA